MNKFILGALLVPMTFLASCGGKQDKKSSVSLSNDNDTISYALGTSPALIPSFIPLKKAST